MFIILAIDNDLKQNLQINSLFLFAYSFLLFASVMAASFHEQMCHGTACTSLFLTDCVLFDKIWSYNASVEMQPFGF